MVHDVQKPKAAEFFAGIGLVRLGLERAGVDVVFANDIDPTKRKIYAENFDAADFLLRDICDVTADDIPNIDIATASFPCTDLSLAGTRKGLAGAQSGMFWEFARLIGAMEERRPRAVLLENVPSFVSSHGGRDLRAAIQALNSHGYSCDIISLDARWFVPQSRPRLFIVGVLDPMRDDLGERSAIYRSAPVARFCDSNRDLDLFALPLPELPVRTSTLRDCVSKLAQEDSRWWEPARLAGFLDTLSPIQRARLDARIEAPHLSWATAYRRTRAGVAVWEVRADELSGCLRTARGGSSKQAIVEAGRGEVRVRWMLPTEYAVLQGASGFRHDTVSDNQALFGFGDAVCVPAIEWLARHCLLPVNATAAEHAA
jgi:DNA (cytosine-5)-methyltransferase 1